MGVFAHEDSQEPLASLILVNTCKLGPEFNAGAHLYSLWCCSPFARSGPYPRYIVCACCHQIAIWKEGHVPHASCRVRACCLQQWDTKMAALLVSSWRRLAVLAGIASKVQAHPPAEKVPKRGKPFLHADKHSHRRRQGWDRPGCSRLCSAAPSACQTLAVLSSAADAIRPLDEAAALQLHA